MASTVIRSELGPSVTLLTLDRPERLNALNRELVEDLHAALDAVAADDQVRVVVLTGAGRGFCAGLDLKEPPSGDGVVGGLRAQERLAGIMLKLRALPQPVIAAVNGPAAGGGLALALASDVRLAAPEARFNVAFVRIGVSGADMGVSYFLPRIVGLGHASELMLTGRLVDAEEAARIGLANRVVPANELLGAARELAAEIVRNAPFGVRMTKEVLGHNVDAQSPAAAIALENRTQILATQTGDILEAMQAFVEKREPRWSAG
jgi:enoyl-CoA hydratase